jgi:uncharacterized protein YjeT (DUF2065 family)
MINAFHRLWLACFVIVVSGLLHALLVAPNAWEGVRATQAYAGSANMWDYLRAATVLLPGLGVIVLWERLQKKKSEAIDLCSTKTERDDYQSERAA